jgi:predicted nucleic acid-binding protein
MRTIFVDTAYWVAQMNTNDQWHLKSLEIEQSLYTVEFITSELVLVEFLNYFCKFGMKTRQKVANATDDILIDFNIKVIWQTQELFKSGLKLYSDRLDKGYSLTDCVSMVIMKQLKLNEILTHDKHFSQEGFRILL